MNRRALLALLLCSVSLKATAVASSRKRVIGTTLHPYYSFAVNIVGDLATVVPLVDSGLNPHNYNPQPADLKRAMTLDALIVNGVGHDPFAMEIVRAAGMEKKLKIISANERVALLPVSGLESGVKVVNPHTFIGVSAAVQQIYTIADALGALDAGNAAAYRQNARAYAARLRRLKADAMQRIASLPSLDLRCAAVHGSYDYLLQEFGLQIDLVVEPAHGAEPSAAGLKRTIDALRARNIQVLFAEEEFPAAYVDTIRAATGVQTRFLKHLSNGEFTADNFEIGMRHNLEQLTAALLDAHKKK